MSNTGKTSSSASRSTPVAASGDSFNAYGVSPIPSASGAVQSTNYLEFRLPNGKDGVSITVNAEQVERKIEAIRFNDAIERYGRS